MSNLATMVMEGATFGIGGKLQRHYDHENGAGLIAMECAEALRDIFEAQFYTVNTCEIQAALEGASCVEESSQAAIMEGAIKSAFEKIKQFFIGLKEKVKEFLHNIKRYLLGIFGDTEKWVKSYEKELRALKSEDLKDYKVKMYNYTVEGAWDKATLDKEADDLKNTIEKNIAGYKSASAGVSKDNDNEEELKKDADQQYHDFIEMLAGKSIDEDEFEKALWSQMRGKADDESDKEDVVVSQIMGKMIDTLKTSSKTIAAYDNMISKCDSMYTKAIKTVNDAEKKFGAIKGDADGDITEDGRAYYKHEQSYVLAALRVYSSTLSKMQSAQNRFNNAAKSAVVERNSAYKSALTGAFAYARKHKGGK